MVRTPWDQYSNRRWLEIPDRFSGKRVEKEMREQISNSVFLGHLFMEELSQLGDLNEAFLVFSEQWEMGEKKKKRQNPSYKILTFSSYLTF